MRRVLLIVLLAGLAAVGGFFAWASRHPAIAPLAGPPEASRFDAKLVEKGKLLAAMGYCAVCHTRADGPPLAGGVKLPTPFGAIYSTNITPDPETGIGRWSEAAFRRAMHEGLDREGRHLYPAFPYDHFTRVSDEDIGAIYAYLMTQKPARYAAPANELGFPFGIRALLAGWKLLFFEAGRYVADPKRDAAWNRGAYLAEGLGHCGSCHTPRNAFGALRKDAKFAGAVIEGWRGIALDADSPAPVKWTAEAMTNYLLDGRDPKHGIAAGPMTPVVDLLADQSDDDIAGLASYVLSFQAAKRDDTAAAIAFAEERQLVNTPGAPAPAMDAALQPGHAIFMRACVSCHRKGEKYTPLALTSVLNDADPRNAVQITLQGLRPPRASRGFTMPAHAWMSDKELADLLRFLRGHFTRKAPWPDLERTVHEVRTGKAH
ncbi:MAG: cytochrome c [Alphaproteobacteria bacterium]|nr:cytochrome c [Alphaproteobacteria bacterium]